MPPKSLKRLREDHGSNKKIPEIQKRGRGRPPKNGDSVTRVTCMLIPVTDQDEEEVECKLCQNKFSSREFRIHNMQEHSNIATTTDDPTIPEHKFYERRLKELAKFTKVKTFKCPTNGCNSAYKSTLGMAYHLETCGKSKEEIELCLIKCDQCDLKFTLPNLSWHKKSHHSTQVLDDPDTPSLTDQEIKIRKLSTSQRKSAIKAREIFQKEANDDDLEDIPPQSKSSKKKSQDQEWNAEAFDIEFAKDGCEVESSKQKSKSSKKNSSLGKYNSISTSTSTSGKSDFTTNATHFMNSKTSNSFWDVPARVKDDIFVDISDNRWQEVEMMKEYLPNQTQSITFKTEVETTPRPVLNEHLITKDFRNLQWLKGEVIDEHSGNLIFNPGGPVFGMSWHCSGKFLAISTGNDSCEDLDYQIVCKRKSCIQIYSHFYKEKVSQKSVKVSEHKITSPINFLTPQLIICADYGYVTHIQWGSFWPDCWNDFSCIESKFMDKRQKTARMGFVACCFEDGTIKMYSLRVGDFMMKRNFSLDRLSKIPVYKKVPEICLKIDESLYPKTGQICRFDWHEENRFLIAGYCSGVVSIFDLKTSSALLREIVTEDESQVTVFSPFWVFQAHVGPVTGVHFDPVCPRYFVTASKDRFLKIWDMNMRKETECRKVGLVVDTCWIRGWIHVAVAVDASISNLSSQYNFVRFYQIGHSQGKPNCAEFMDISSLSFSNGITIQATENGNVSATYFDHFWRECDYDRNKKKHNLVNICKVSLDKTKFEPTINEENGTFNPLGSNTEKPRVVFTFFKERLRAQILKDPNVQYFEDYIRYMPFLRINKLSWCPSGNYFAVGYRSGLLTIVPANFNSLYS